VKTCESYFFSWGYRGVVKIWAGRGLQPIWAGRGLQPRPQHFIETAVYSFSDKYLKI
jgi:hypothetical protein